MREKRDHEESGGGTNRSRVCATNGCGTYLNRYNKGLHCFLHQKGLVVSIHDTTYVAGAMQFFGDTSTLAG